MKIAPYLVLLALGSCTTLTEKPGEPSYVAEAPLPQGWPTPGPYNQVSLKSYPRYRAAFTRQKGDSLAFWRLFSHIRKNNIPMTAPVEMGMSEDGLETSSMAFLYQSGKVGKTGPAGETVEVRDVPASKALSYTWQGVNSKANILKARQALDASLAANNQKPKAFRLLGYNGPGNPKAKRTWELQALLD